MGEPFATQAVRAAYGWGRPQDWTDAVALLARAVEAEEQDAERQHALVTQQPFEQLLVPPQPERLSPTARIAVVRGFAPPGFPEWLIERASGRLEQARANDAGGNAVRTATTCGFGPRQADLVVAIMQERAARLAGVPIVCHEPPNAIHYQPGQEYGLHADFIEPSIAQFQDELRIYGQRVATFVTYLNDDFEGAATEFPDLGIAFRGAPGDAVFFANVLTDGTPDYKTAHRAPPPTSGEKWVLSQWIRSKPFSLAPEDQLH